MKDFNRNANETIVLLKLRRSNYFFLGNASLTHISYLQNNLQALIRCFSTTINHNPFRLIHT